MLRASRLESLFSARGRYFSPSYLRAWKNHSPFASLYEIAYFSSIFFKFCELDLGVARMTACLRAEDLQRALHSFQSGRLSFFFSFLDRVYPVAIIAMLIYLPTAADYSLVTWHGIPPTGKYFTYILRQFCFNSIIMNFLHGLVYILPF